MLPDAETIVQGVHLGAVLLSFLVLYRATREDSPLPAKAKWAILLSGMFLVGGGMLLRLFGGGPVIDALFLKHIGFDTGVITIGYSLVILAMVCVFQSKRTD
jgi:hypothetical protein